MCTLSIICVNPAPGESLLRVAMSRDESVTRAAAQPPRWHALADGARGLWPTDPVGGGTWVGVNRQGLVLCLLNYNLEPTPTLPPGLTSRGSIIPALVGGSSPDAARRLLERLDLARFAPFRLVMAQLDRGGETCGWVGLEARWDRRTFEVLPAGPGAACYVSSGLGDSKARPRLELFDSMLGRSPSAAAQDAFHDHQWAERPEVSVRMARREARTVSITTVETLRLAQAPRALGVHVRYRPLEEADRARARITESPKVAEIGAVPQVRVVGCAASA